MKELRIWESSNYKAINEYRTKGFKGTGKPKILLPYGDIYGPDPDPAMDGTPKLGGNTMTQGQTANQQLQADINTNTVPTNSSTSGGGY